MGAFREPKKPEKLVLACYCGEFSHIAIINNFYYVNLKKFKVYKSLLGFLNFKCIVDN